MPTAFQGSSSLTTQGRAPSTSTEDLENHGAAGGVWLQVDVDAGIGIGIDTNIDI